MLDLRVSSSQYASALTSSVSDLCECASLYRRMLTKTGRYGYLAFAGGKVSKDHGGSVT